MQEHLGRLDELEVRARTHAAFPPVMVKGRHSPGAQTPMGQVLHTLEKQIGVMERMIEERDQQVVNLKNSLRDSEEEVQAFKATEKRLGACLASHVGEFDAGCGTCARCLGHALEVRTGDLAKARKTLRDVNDDIERSDTVKSLRKALDIANDNLAKKSKALSEQRLIVSEAADKLGSILPF